MYQRGDIKEGMTVRSADGHKLGKVYAVGDGEFHIEKGLFFPKDYSCRYEEIRDLRNGEIILAHGQESLRDFSDEVPYGADTIATREGIGTSRVIRQPGVKPEPPSMRARYHDDEVAPLRAEEQEARRRALLDETSGLRREGPGEDDPLKRGAY